MTGDEQHLVTITPPDVLSPIISLDGSKVAYTVSDANGSKGYVVHAADSKSRPVCNDCTFSGWFADNQRIIASYRDGYVRATDVVDGTAVDLSVKPKGPVGRFEVSPDGRWLSFFWSSNVWIAPVRLGNPPPQRDWVVVHTVADDDSAERACGWSPDSGLLYLLLERDGFRDLYAQRIDRARGTRIGEPFRVQHLHDPRRRWGSTPLGTAIVRNAFILSQVEMTGSIWLLDSPQDMSRAGGNAR